MIDKAKNKRDARIRRHKRVRARISGTAQIPRLNVFRSNRELYVQLIDDVVGKTLASVSDAEIKTGKVKTDKAKEAGKLIAEKAKKMNITKVVFDRGGYKYHGRVQALAESARENGLEF